MINFPTNCKTEAQRLSYVYKLLEVVHQEHNNSGMDDDIKYKIKECHRVRNDELIIEAENLNHHNMGLGHVVGGIVNFPASINPNNEGARLSALYALHKILRENHIEISDDFKSKMNQAKDDAVTGRLQQSPYRWQPSLEDIT